MLTHTALTCFSLAVLACKWCVDNFTAPKYLWQQMASPGRETFALGDLQEDYTAIGYRERVWIEADPLAGK